MGFSSRFEAIDRRQLWGIFTLSLLAYCLGHGAITQQPVFPALSLAWSVSHATGLIVIKTLLDVKGARRRDYLFPLVIGLALGLSQALFFALTWMTGDPYPLHGYSSVVMYCIVGLTWWAFLRSTSPQADGIWVDYGQQKAWLAAKDIVLVRAAKNYVAIVANHQSSEGIVRSSITNFAQTHGGLLRVHRSTLVNPANVMSIQRRPRGCLNLVLLGDHEVKVSSSYSQSVLHTLHLVPQADNSSQSQ